MAAFGSSMPAGVTDEAAAQMLDRRKSVLDFVREDIGVFKRRLAAKDAENLDFYLDGIRSLESKLSSAPELLSAGAACNPGPVQSAAAGATSVAGDLARFKAMGEAMLDIVSTGFACGSLRVATMVWQPGSYGINPASGSFGNTREHHDISHNASARSKWAEIDRWYADRFAYLVKRLKDLQVLDRTAVVWGTDISEAHNSNDFVNVVAGGRSLGIKSNQNIVYPFYYPNLAQGEALKAARDARHKSLADLWVSVQKALGKRDDHFGDLQYSNGGLQELYAG